jgi:hypothetical protein
MATSIVQAIPGVSNVTLSVKSDLVQPYKYQWYRNNLALGGSQWVTYTLLNVSPDDMKAKWYVVVYGQNGTEQSPDYTLSTAPPPPQPPVPGATVSVQAPPAPPAAPATSAKTVKNPTTGKWEFAK